MQGSIRHGHLVFDREYRTAVDDAGNEVRFTRAERMVLERFARQPGVTLSRDILLDAVSGQASDTSDRNIDFLVNRLRRKLSDKPGEPQFIATRYGEGYAWVAEAGNNGGSRLIAFGPVTALDDTHRFRVAGEMFADGLEKAVLARIRDAAPLVPHARTGGDGDRPAFRIELCFLELDDRLDCALTLKRADSVLMIERATVAGSNPDGIRSEPLVERIAASAVDRVWHSLAPKASDPQIPHELPPAVRLHDAAEQVSRPDLIWQENEDRLRKALRDDPGDPVAKLMLATALHGKYIQSGISILATSDPRAEDEAEIERLVTEALPDLQDNGIFALTGAKLLTFVSQAHRPMAMAMAERAFRLTTAFAAACSLHGQLCMWEGDTARALELYDKAQSLATAGSHFHLYVLTLKCQAQTADGNDAAVAQLLEELCGSNSHGRQFFSMLFDNDAYLDLAADREIALSSMTPAHAGAVLTYRHYTCARMFVEEGHAAISWPPRPD